MQITIKRKKVKNIYLKVTPNKEVILTAPYFVDDLFLERFLESKKEWISKKLALFSKEIIKKEYVSGEDFEFLGKRFILKVKKHNKNLLKLDGKYCYLYVKEDNFEEKEKVIKKWYRKEAKKIFVEIVDKFVPIVGREPAKVSVREMKTRWGSCNYQKRYINLNLELIKKPKECIEYVVFHELSHLIYPNHSKEFYNYLSIYMPDWKKRKELLNRI